MKREDILDKKDIIIEMISRNYSKAAIARELHCKPETLNKYLKIMNINYNGNQGGKGNGKRKETMSLLKYLSNSKDIQSNKVRLKLLEEGYKEYRCECCGLSQWLGKPIPLELHHKDGNKNNNCLDNYMLLCPNCHAFTESYRGRNCKK